MSPERALEIWAARRSFGELSMTERERAEVKRVWRRMPGHTCFADALLRIGRGEAEALPEMVGTAVFRCGDQIVEQTPVDAGEEAEPGFPSVMERAKRSIRLLGMPATDPVHGANTRLCKLERATVTFHRRGH